MRCRTQKIDTKEFKKWFGGLGISPKEFDESIGAQVYSNILSRGYCSLMAYNLILLKYKLPEGSFVPQTATEAEEVEESASIIETEKSSSETEKLLASIDSKLAELLALLK